MLGGEVIRGEAEGGVRDAGVEGDVGLGGEAGGGDQKVGGEGGAVGEGDGVGLRGEGGDVCAVDGDLACADVVVQIIGTGVVVDPRGGAVPEGGLLWFEDLQAVFVLVATVAEGGVMNIPPEGLRDLLAQPGLVQEGAESVHAVVPHPRREAGDESSYGQAFAPGFDGAELRVGWEYPDGAFAGGADDPVHLFAG